MKIAEPYKMENYINIISDDFEWDTNWKLLTENFMEGYFYYLEVKELLRKHPKDNSD